MKKESVKIIQYKEVLEDERKHNELMLKMKEECPEDYIDMFML